jgi:hypothetical protein
VLELIRHLIVLVNSAQAQPSFRFNPISGAGEGPGSQLHCVLNHVRFSWELGPEAGPPLAGGVDFGVVSDGRLRSINEFLDFAPGASGE